MSLILECIVVTSSVLVAGWVIFLGTYFAARLFFRHQIDWQE